MSHKRSRANFEADYAPPFALFGTPLPPLDSDSRDDGSYVPLWKQDVRDEQGRKRFHGAFTGGYSAGYFNTVGSKEGWAPSTFVSSRTNRRKDVQAPTQIRPEDLMDDEDLADAAEAQKLQTQDSFAGFGSTSQENMRRGLLSDLFRPAGETMGVKLLQKMGWRQGQGVGPKVRRRARPEPGATAPSDEQTHLFAPENSRLVAFTRKKDRFGLGYAAEERLGEATPSAQRNNLDEEDISSYGRPAKTKPKAKRTGFGVGILNDTGSDEEDPYDMGPKISYSRIIGGDRKKKKGGIIANTAKGAAQPTFLPKKLGQRINSGFRKCHDGRLPLDGFVLASSLMLNDQDNKHPPPVIPVDWEPSRTAASASTSDPSKFQSTADAARASTLDPARRAAVLGEELLSGKSIFDYMNAAARDRLVSATGRVNLPVARGENAPEGWKRSEADKQKSLWDLVPRLDGTIAAAALQRGISGWMPYAEDEAKRARYRAFLEISSGQRDTLPERGKSANTDDWVREMCEFVQAAEVFKPISGLMASRFTSSSSSPQLATDAVPSTEQPSKPEDPAEAAAKIGMFGPMTRSRLQFYPTRLLCKRFNVKAPSHADPGKVPTGDDENARDSRLDVVSQTKIDQMMRETWSKPQAAATGDPAESVTDTAQSQKPQQVDMEVNEAIEAERPGDAVFKAIFGSDSEDE